MALEAYCDELEPFFLSTPQTLVCLSLQKSVIASLTHNLRNEFWQLRLRSKLPWYLPHCFQGRPFGN